MEGSASGRRAPRRNLRSSLRRMVWLHRGGWSRARFYRSLGRSLGLGGVGSMLGRPDGLVWRPTADPSRIRSPANINYLRARTRPPPTPGVVTHGSRLDRPPRSKNRSDREIPLAGAPQAM